jgi:hypothetical protein
MNAAVKINKTFFQSGVILFLSDAVYPSGGFTLERVKAFVEQCDPQMME